MRSPIRANTTFSFQHAGLAVLILWFAVAAQADGFADIENYLDEYRKMAAFDGVVLIAEANQIVWQKAIGMADYEHGVDMDPSTRFRIASLSKQVTQAAIGRLIDSGQLSLGTRLADFLPEFPQAKRITIGQLLEHSAGVAHTNRLPWMDMTRPMTLDEIVAGLANEPLSFRPGVDRQYSNGGYALLAKVIEVATDGPFAEFIKHEFADRGYPSLGHEAAADRVAGMAVRYAPGPDYGERIPADTYVAANRIGGGSLYAAAVDVYRFFRDSYTGKLLAEDTTAAIFKGDGDQPISVTGRAPGALAQISMDLDNDIVVVTLSSNSAWPASLNRDVAALYRGENVSLRDFELSSSPLSVAEMQGYTGHFAMPQFGWMIELTPHAGQLMFIEGQMRTAFHKTNADAFHLPIYDWLCVFSAYNTEFECRQRTSDSSARFLFERR